MCAYHRLSLLRKLEVGNQKSEVGSRKSEVGSWKLEVGSRKSEVGSRKTLLGFRNFRQIQKDNFAQPVTHCVTKVLAFKYHVFAPVTQ